MGDVGGLGGPGRDGAGAGSDDLHEAGDRALGAARAVGEQFFQDGVLLGAQLGGQLRDVHEPGGQGADGKTGGGEVGAQFFQAKRREGGGAAEGQHGREKPRMFRDRAGAVKERGGPAGILARGAASARKNPLTTPPFLP